MRNVNVTHVTNITNITTIINNPQPAVGERDYRNRKFPHAVTVVPANTLTTRQPVAAAAAQWRSSPAVRELANEPSRSNIVAAPQVAAPPPQQRRPDAPAVRPTPAPAGGLSQAIRERNPNFKRGDQPDVQRQTPDGRPAQPQAPAQRLQPALPQAQPRRAAAAATAAAASPPGPGQPAGGGGAAGGAPAADASKPAVERGAGFYDVVIVVEGTPTRLVARKKSNVGHLAQLRLDHLPERAELLRDPLDPAARRDRRPDHPARQRHRLRARPHDADQRLGNAA